MRYLKIALRLTLITLILNTGTALSLRAGDPVTEAQNWAKKAKDEADKAVAAAADLDCEKPKSSDVRKLVKAVKAAREAAKNARQWANEAKTTAETAATTADANPNNKAAQKAKAEAAQAKTASDTAAKEAEANYARALDKAPAMKAASDIEKALDDTDQNNNSEKVKIAKRLKDTANAAAEKNPCDPEEVKRVVRVELDKIKNEVARNGEMKPWVDDLYDALKGGELIFFQPQPDRAQLLLGFTAQLQSNPQLPASLFGSEQFGDLEKSVYGDPALLEKLFERLGGEFWFGTFSQPGAFGATTTTPLRSFGLQAILPIGKRIAIQTGVTQGNFTSRANFPVTIIDNDKGETRQMEGHASVEIKSLQVQASGRAYFFSPGTVQLYAGIGAQYARQTAESPQAELGGASWTFGSKTENAHYDLLGQAGISLQPRGWPVFAEFGISYQKALGENAGKAAPVLQASVGWKLK